MIITSKRLNSSNEPIDGTLKSTTSPGQSGPESNGNEKVLYIPQYFRTGTSPSDNLVSYQETHRRDGKGSYFSAEMQSVYSTAQADWAVDYSSQLAEIGDQVQSKIIMLRTRFQVGYS